MRVELPFAPARPRRVWPGTDLFRQLCANPDWIAEPKKNGWRCFILADAGKVQLVSRQSRLIRDQSPARHVKVPSGTWLDSELQRGVLWVFDAIKLAGADLAGLPLEERRAELAQLIPELGQVRLMPRVNAAKYIEGTKDEGVVFKHAGRPYPTGETNYWIKARR